MSSENRDRNKDKQFTGVHINGGRDADIDNLKRTIDLKVDGGALIKKNVIVSGNLTVQNVMFGSLIGDVFTQKIQEKELGYGIDIIGGLNICDGLIKLDDVQILGPQQPTINGLIDNTDGAISDTLGPVNKIVDSSGLATTESTQSAIDDITNSIASIQNKLNEIIITLKNHGLIAND